MAQYEEIIKTGNKKNRQKAFQVKSGNNKNTMVTHVADNTRGSCKLQIFLQYQQ